MEQYSVASKLNPDWDFLTHLRDIGREVAAEWLNKNYKAISNNSTINWDEFL